MKLQPNKKYKTLEGKYIVWKCHHPTQDTALFSNGFWYYTSGANVGKFCGAQNDNTYQKHIVLYDCTDLFLED